MSPRSKKELYDVEQACQAVLAFMQGRTEQDYGDDLYFRSATERQLMIIGEAMVRLREADPDCLDTIGESRSIIGFRNILVHGYDSVDTKIVWSIMTEKVPMLLRDVQSLLQSN